MRRLILVRHGATTATRKAAFPLDEPLEERAYSDAARLRGALPHACEVLASPSLRCRQTAEAAGLEPLEETRIAECDFGSWAGRSLADVHDEDAAGTRDWMLDPDAAPHGGESLTSFFRRVGSWLDEQSERDGTVAAITHGGVVKAAIVRALAAPIESFWRVDCSPLAISELHAHEGRWTVARMNASLTAPLHSTVRT